MTEYEKYGLVLCLIVIALLALVFTALIGTVCRQSLQLIRCGAKDKQIKTEYLKKRRKKREGVAGKTLSAIFYVAVFAVFACSFAMRVSETSDIFPAAVRVVKSGSMSNKYKKNAYLFENNLNDQFQTFDLIITRSMPDEFDLQLYDIVVYRSENKMVIHRIVKIEEPNAEHPEHRLFILQGDNVAIPDLEPVTYAQMEGIYRGERVPAVGSFVLFLQSPAGYACLVLLVISVTVTPLLERKIERAKQERFGAILQKAREKKRRRESVGRFLR